MKTQTAIRIIGKGIMTASGNRFFLVSSSDYASNNRAYIVEHKPGHFTCNCPARKPCKHIKLVAALVSAEIKEAAQPIMRQPCYRCGGLLTVAEQERAAGKENVLCDYCEGGEAMRQKWYGKPADKATALPYEAPMREPVMTGTPAYMWK